MESPPTSTFADGQPEGRDTALALAEELVALVRQSPVDAAARVDQILKSNPDPLVTSVAWRVRGLALRHTGTMAESVDALRHAVATAEECSDRELAADAALSLSGSLALAGSLGDAATLLEQTPPPNERVGARMKYQRASILGRAGQLVEAETVLDDALGDFERLGDVQFVAEAHANLGRIRLELGELRLADANLRKAVTRFSELDQAAAIAFSTQNLAEVLLAQGDLVGTLQLLDESFATLDRVTETSWEPQVVRIAALVAAGLFEEAVEVGLQVRQLMSRAGLELDAPEAELMLSRAFWALGSYDEAKVAADRALDTFGRQGRDRWALRARIASARSDQMKMGHDSSATHAKEIRDLAMRAEKLDDRQLTFELAEMEAHLATDESRLDDAERAAKLQQRWAQRGRLDHELGVAFVCARLSALRGNNGAALRTVGRALTAAEEQATTLGALELSVHASRHTDALAQFGLDLAVNSTAEATLFRFSELSRARSTQLRPVRPPTDSGVADLFGRVRALSRRAENASLEEQRVARVELAIASRDLRDVERRRPGQAQAARQIPALAALRKALGNSTLISIVATGAGKLVLQSITQTATIRREVGQLSFVSGRFRRLQRTLELLALGASKAEEEAETIATELDGLLGEVPGTGHVIIVPPAQLFDAPWSALPGLRNRSVVISPSATTFYSGLGVPLPLASVTALGGPDLDHAKAEVATVISTYPSGIATGNADASCEEALSALGSSDLVHLCCHALHRCGNPLFSSLRLDDGPLSLLELDGQPRIAPMVLLSSCSAGSVDTVGQRAFLGLATVLLRQGARSVVASTGLVPDTAATVSSVQNIHDSLIRGTDPSTAIRQARSAELPEVLAASMFTCFGSSPAMDVARKQ